MAFVLWNQEASSKLPPNNGGTFKGFSSQIKADLEPRTYVTEEPSRVFGSTRSSDVSALFWTAIRRSLGPQGHHGLDACSTPRGNC